MKHISKRFLTLLLCIAILFVSAFPGCAAATPVAVYRTSMKYFLGVPDSSTAKTTFETGETFVFLDSSTYMQTTSTRYNPEKALASKWISLTISCPGAVIEGPYHDLAYGVLLHCDTPGEYTLTMTVQWLSSKANGKTETLTVPFTVIEKEIPKAASGIRYYRVY